MNSRILAKTGWGVTAACFVCLAQAVMGDAIVIAVDDAQIPVGGTTVIEVVLDAAVGPVSALGATLTYDPALLSVQFAGIGPTSLGGPTQAVHLVSREPGRIVFGGALPGGSTHVPSAPEPFLRLQVMRLLGDTSEVRLEDPFYLPAGSTAFQPVAPSNLVFGIISGDSDGDGILDAWEFLHFFGLSTATATSDFDQDGVRDVDEFLAGTPPRIPYLTSLPAMDELHPAGVYRVTLALPTEAGVTYTIEWSASLTGLSWDAVTFALSPGGPAVHQAFVGTGAVQVVEIPVWGAGPRFFRIVVPAL